MEVVQSTTPVTGFWVKEVKDTNGSKDLCKLYVDVNEPAEIVEMLKREKGIYVEVRRQDSRVDYCFSNIGIERKTLSDFYNSITHGDKHIWKQIFTLKHCFERPMLVIERWDPSFLTSKNVERTVYGAMARIFLHGVSVVVIPGRGTNVRDFVEFLALLFYSSDKKTLSMKPVPEKSKSPNKREALSDLICMIPMIGRKAADEIAGRVSSIEELCRMNDEDLKKLSPSLGKKRIEMMRWVLNGKEPEGQKTFQVMQESLQPETVSKR